LSSFRILETIPAFIDTGDKTENLHILFTRF
jgi:hypothetical protein